MQRLVRRFRGSLPGALALLSLATSTSADTLSVGFQSGTPHSVDALDAYATLPSGDRVVFGATVDLEDQDDGSHITYQIVGEDEADIRRGLISVGSPIARALVGKSKGDLIEVDVPAGRRNYEVIAIRFV